jgi:hypothetical protein
MCHEERWSTFSLIDGACMREAGLPQGWAHAVRDYMARDLGWEPKTCGRGFLYIFLLSHNPGVPDVRFKSLFTCPLGAGGAHGLGSLF